MPARPSVVFDCNVFLQAIVRADGPAAAALRLVERGTVELHVSRAVLRELRLTLAYPELRRRNAHLTGAVVAEYVARISFRATLCHDVPHVFDLPRDPDDEPYIDLAAAVSADYLVTRDNDLLSLATDHSIEAKQFRQRFPRLRLIDPVVFVAAVDAPRRG